MSMTKRERCMAAVRGEKPDHIPYGMWSHMPHVDHDADANTEATYEFYKKYDLDFVKTMNNGMYSIEDFGCEIDFSEVAKGGMAHMVSSPIQDYTDWCKLTAPSVHEGAMGRELRYLQQILDRLKADQDDAPVLFTVFSPISTVNKMCGGEAGRYIHEGHGAEVKLALELVTEVTKALAVEAIRMGADGVFMATQMSTFDTGISKYPLTLEEYVEYGKAYDVQVIQAAKEAGAWMNTLHCHGTNIMFDILRDYPVDVFNWHAWETDPTIDEAQVLTGKCLMGGLKRFDITECNYNAIRHQIYDCCRITGGKGFILTPGCVVRYPLNDAMLSYVKRTKTMVEEALGLL